MEMNFAFLEKKQEYELFSGACIDAERILESSPVMSAVASRKALELCVKWIYSIDSALEPIGNREGLQSLLHNNGFPSLMASLISLTMLSNVSKRLCSVVTMLKSARFPQTSPISKRRSLDLFPPQPKITITLLG